MLPSLMRATRRAVIALGATLALTGAVHAAETTYKVGSTPTGVPFTFLDVKTNQIEGIMVDIVEAVAREEGFAVEIEATQWAALIPSLTSGKIDIIAAAMYATAERAKVVAFTEPVYTYGEGLFVAKDDGGTYQSLDDLAGKTVGVQVGTAYYDVLRDSGKFKEVKVYDSIADIMRDVALGRIDAGFGDRPIVAYQLSKGASPVRLVEEYASVITGSVALAVRQDDPDLLAKLNDGIEKLKSSGELDQIVAKWGV